MAAMSLNSKFSLRREIRLKRVQDFSLEDHNREATNMFLT